MVSGVDKRIKSIKMDEGISSAAQKGKVFSLNINTCLFVIPALKFLPATIIIIIITIIIMFYNLELRCLIWQPLVTCHYWAFKTWVVQTEMCWKCQLYTKFQELSMKKRVQNNHLILITDWNNQFYVLG